MTALGSGTRSRTRAEFALFLGVASLMLSACAADNGSMESNVESAPPDNATLCKLKPGKTSLDEAKSILGKPDVQTGSAHDQAAGLAYTYADAALTLPFVDGVLTMPAVAGSLKFPDCWSGK